MSDIMLKVMNDATVCRHDDKRLTGCFVPLRLADLSETDIGLIKIDAIVLHMSRVVTT